VRPRLLTRKRSLLSAPELREGRKRFKALNEELGN
jgi:hypothetical protein